MKGFFLGIFKTISSQFANSKDHFTDLPPGGFTTFVPNDWLLVDVEHFNFTDQFYTQL